MNKFDIGEQLLSLEEKKEDDQTLSQRIENAHQSDIKNLLKEIAALPSESEQSTFITKLAQKFQIDRRAIKNDLKRLLQTDTKDKEIEEIMSAGFPGLVDMVLDDEEKVIYLIKSGESLLFTPTRNVAGVLHIPPNRTHLPFALPRGAEVLRWYKEDDPGHLFESVMHYLQRFAFLSEAQLIVIALSVFATYVQDHGDIHYLPMILFYAVPERGKSRTGKAAAYISFRGVHCVDLREANLFRFAQDLKATLFIDIMDLWRKAEKNGSEDILLLRYERGAKATRVIYPERGAFKDTVHYNIYGPTFIATNEAIHKILDSRCLPINMINRPGDYENPTPEIAQELKERLTAWRARTMDAALPVVSHVRELNGRLWDISQPLLQVCKMVSPQRYDPLKSALIEVAGRRIEDRRDSIEGVIVSALYNLSPEETENLPEWTIKTQEALTLINETRPDSHKLTGHYLGRKIRSLGIRTRIVHGRSEILLKMADFTTLLVQYGILENNNSYHTCENLPKSTKVTEQGISTVCTGRLSTEDTPNPYQSLPDKNNKNQGVTTLVDIGRLLPTTGEKKFLKTLEIVE